MTSRIKRSRRASNSAPSIVPTADIHGAATPPGQIRSGPQNVQRTGVRVKGIYNPLCVAVLAAFLLGCAACGGEAGAPQSTVSISPDYSTDPSPDVPFKRVVLKGSGSRLTNQFELPAGDYKISWSIKAVGGYCCPNLIADMVGADKTNIAASADPSGSTLFQSAGGFFRIQTDASGTAWTITIEKI